MKGMVPQDATRRSPLIVLHGVKKNVGDALIYTRARALIEQELGGPLDVQLRDYWLDDRIEEVNASRGIVLCGGPAYGTEFYPRTFALTRPISRIRVPILPMGLGWGGQPWRDPERFKFTTASLQALRFLSGRVESLGCRDVLTVEVLQRAGILNARMVGCPAWYDLRSIGRAYEPPSEVRRVVFTPPQNLGLRPQAVPIMKTLATLFPKAERFCVFHKGWEFDRYTKAWRDVAWNRWLRRRSMWLGFQPVNAAYDVDRIEFYRDCDLHVGYRVHAHVFFLSVRKPIILLHEDGRGMGQSRTLDLSDISGHSDDPRAQVEARLREDLDDGFRRFESAVGTIDRTYDSMRAHVRSIN